MYPQAVTTSLSGCFLELIRVYSSSVLILYQDHLESNLKTVDSWRSFIHIQLYSGRSCYNRRYHDYDLWCPPWSLASSFCLSILSLLNVVNEEKRRSEFPIGSQWSQITLLHITLDWSTLPMSEFGQYNIYITYFNHSINVKFIPGSARASRISISHFW